MPLLDLPDELLEHILILSDPIDVSHFAQTCGAFRGLVYQAPDDTLWRCLYLTHLELDDPRQCVTMDGQPRPAIQWSLEVQRAIRARTLVTTNSLGRPGEIGTVLETLVGLTTLVKPMAHWDTGFDGGTSKTLLSISVLLRHGWIDLVERQPLAAHERQLISKLHTYFGLTQNDLQTQTRTVSRAFVYNAQNYVAESDFGPFFENGTVDWVHVKAIHHLMSMQVIEDELAQTNAQAFEYAVYPLSLPYTQIVAAKEDDYDWLGVTGEWEVSFSFIDHTVLMRYNSTITRSGIPGDISIFDDEDFDEVFRVMKVDIRVLKTQPDPHHPRNPVIFFAGAMRNLTNSVMNGKAWMASDGTIRWRFISGEATDPIWSSEGVQIGGLRSHYGVLGSWSTTLHEPEDPVGPFWMRKAPASHTAKTSSP